jgi:sugar phosphate isomerase/epimerase
MPQRLSFQLYSARDHGPLADVLALLARVGYREVEGFGGAYRDPKKVRQLLEKHGLTMPTGHFDLDLLENDRGRALAIARTLGIRHIYCPYIAEEQRPRSAAGWTRFGKRLASIGAAVRGEGLSFGWHNHDFEFRKLPDGSLPIERLFAAAPMIDWECDVAWVARAVRNPVRWIKTFAARITAVHVKDIARPGENTDEDGWADVGKGVLDWPALFRTLGNSRTLHYVMEHDRPRDLERFARNSFNFVKAI